MGAGVLALRSDPLMEFGVKGSSRWYWTEVVHDSHLICFRMPEAYCTSQCDPLRYKSSVVRSERGRHGR